MSLLFYDLGGHASTRIHDPFDLTLEGVDLDLCALPGGLEFVLGLGKVIQDVSPDLLVELVPLDRGFHQSHDLERLSRVSIETT